MSEESVTRFLERGAVLPDEGIDLDSLARAAWRRRRRTRIVVVTACVTVLALGALLATRVGSSDGHRGVRTPPAATGTASLVSNANQGVSWTVPDGWQTDALEGEPGRSVVPSDFTAVEELAASTAERSNGLAGPLCDPQGSTPTDAFVSLGEYPDPPAGLSPRPEQFTRTMLEPTALFCDPAAAPVHAYRTAFRDHGRGFVAFVVLGTSASPETEADALALLNSLEVAPTHAADPATAASITTAFTNAIRTDDPTAARSAIDQGDRVPDISAQRAALNIVAEMHVSDVILLEPNRARVRYQITGAGGDPTDPRAVIQSGYGFAIQRDNTWKVSLETACDWVRPFGVTCPTDTTSP